MVKKIEVKKIDLISLVRIAVLLSLVQAVFALIIMILSGAGDLVGALILGPISAALSTLIFGVLYNWLAKSFGGVIVEAEISEKDLF